MEADLRVRMTAAHARVDRGGAPRRRAYEDKLEGHITDAFFQEKRAEWERLRREAARDMERLTQVSSKTLDQAIGLIELSRSAHSLLSQRTPLEQRELLETLLSNSFLTGKVLAVDWREPFCVRASRPVDPKKEEGPGWGTPGQCIEWSGRQDSNLRPLDPQSSALPGCATPRQAHAFYGLRSCRARLNGRKMRVGVPGAASSGAKVRRAPIPPEHRPAGGHGCRLERGPGDKVGPAADAEGCPLKGLLAQCGTVWSEARVQTDHARAPARARIASVALEGPAWPTWRPPTGHSSALRSSGPVGPRPSEPRWRQAEPVAQKRSSGSMSSCSARMVRRRVTSWEMAALRRSVSISVEPDSPRSSTRRAPAMV